MLFLRLLQVFIIQGSMFITYQQVYNCPDPWITFEGSCYNFVFYPTKYYPQAKMTCMMDGAALVSINTVSEHNFVSQWLLSNDPAVNTWYTSGVIDEETMRMKWEGDGTVIEAGTRFWRSDDDRNKPGDHIVYTYGVYDFLWSREYSLISLPYICEISQSEAYKIVKEDRDFDFGSNYTDPALAPKGPKFILQQPSIIVVRTDSSISANIEYMATGIPLPSYSIIHTDGMGNTTEITASLDKRFTVTNGKLTINNPMEAIDTGSYHCIAQNQHGLVVSNPMDLSFGYLGEFSNVNPAPVVVQNHDRAIIDCTPPIHRPAVSYQWYKGDEHFVRPDLHSYMFISRNGKLYFSVVSTNDAGNYRCIVQLSSNNGAAIGTNQPPSRISRPIPLVVENSAASVWGPEIANDFINVSPVNPKRGQNVYLECLAYGTMPLTYYWTRDGLPMPPSAVMEDHNRLLYIPDARVEDSGSYTCHVTRQNLQNDMKSFYLVIESEPFFLFPLKDQHIDQGSQLTWHCAARGIPAPTYFWLKNGVRLQTIAGEITVSNNVLVIHNADPIRHSGMYQCGAVNKHGTSHTEGQLRVLGFAPTFAKRPVEELVYGGISGNASFTCHPDAAPFPSFKWLKNGMELNLVQGDTTARIMMLANGNLLITNVNSNDAGYYTCQAENMFGIATSAGQLVISSRTVINIPPLAATVLLNETAFMRCEASVSQNIDFVYRWNFNGQPINTEEDPHFILGTSQSTTGLFIRMTQHKHAGRYECVVKTPIDIDRAEATLTVNGPPGQIAYVYVEAGTITAISARLGWTLGARYGGPILYYTIEWSSEPYLNWTVLIQNLPETDVIIPIEDQSRRFYLLTGLKPGTAYKFRVKAANMYGVGITSGPSVIYQTLMAPPQISPDNVGGGGGSVADLTITWDPLPTEDHGGPGIGYRVHWRVKGGDKWSKHDLVGNVGVYVTQVGVDYFYLEYEVMVLAFNMLGDGPNSTIVTIYSAEALPIVSVTGVSSYRYNATAIMITWTPVNNSREVMKGIIMGYQVNYYERYQTNPIVNSITWRGLDPYGLIIGLLPNTWYAYDVQVFNTAGLNSISDTYFQRTTLNAPLLFPTEVAVRSHGAESVFISWRGVMTSSIEESLTGYKIRYWLQGDDITRAMELSTGRETHAIIYGISKNELYQLRLCAYSRGGDGNLGNTVYFTLGGQIVIDPILSEIRAGADSIGHKFIVLYLTMYTIFAIIIL